MALTTPTTWVDRCCSIARELKWLFWLIQLLLWEVTGVQEALGPRPGAGHPSDPDQVLLGQQTELVGGGVGGGGGDGDAALLQRVDEGVQVVLCVVLLLVPQLSQTFQDRLHGGLA